jgi:hypothetical protein
MENLTSLISSRGILKSCHSHNRKPESSTPQLDLDLLRNHRAGQTIYVCTEALRNFSDNFLGTIKAPFVLISGDADTVISENLQADPVITAILNNEFLIVWYVQNLAIQHPKLCPLPIGMDYHTMWEKPGSWGISAVSALSQENTLFNTLAASPEFSQRYMNAYCNWRAVAGWGDRQECYEKIDRTVCLFETRAVPRNSTWLRQAEFMFVVSPEGIGMDCHRTWEALILGCIPIVKRNAVAGLFADLPVLIVDDWGDVNLESMRAYAALLPEKKFNFSSLFREHWLKRFAGLSDQLLEDMTFSEFRKTVTRKTG